MSTRSSGPLTDGAPIERTYVDWTVPDPVVTAVTDAVSRAAGVEPTVLDSLYESVDVGLLDRLFAPTAGTPSTVESVTFRHADYRVTLTGDAVEVRPVAPE